MTTANELEQLATKAEKDAYAGPLLSAIMSHRHDFIRLIRAAENLRDCKGRYHSEQATVALFDALVPFKDKP